MRPVYRVAVIGTGFSDQVQIPGFRLHPRFEVAAVVGRNSKRTQAVTEKFGLAKWYTDWREVIDKGKRDFDVVSIVTPPHLHKEMTLAALDAGLPLLCEKPMALHSGEAEQMLKRARETGLTAMIDHEFRYLPGRQRFGQLVREGYIGKLWRITMTVRRGSFANPARPWDWWSDFQQGGGLLGALGSHYFDAIQHWFQQLKRVWGKLSAFIPERPLAEGRGRSAVTADDSFLAVLDLGDGAEALFDFTVSAIAGTGGHTLAFGSEGMLVLEDDQRLLGAKRGEALHGIDLSDLPPAGDDPRVSSFVRLLDDFAAALDQGTSPSPNFEDGLAHQLFIDAIRISNALGGWTDFPPTGPISKGILPRNFP